MDTYMATLKDKPHHRADLNYLLAELASLPAVVAGNLDLDVFVVHVDGRPSHYGAVARVQVPQGTKFQPGPSWHTTKDR